MRKNSKLISLIAIYAIVIIVWMLFFILNVENNLLFLILVIGSVVVFSTSAIYTVLQHHGLEDERLRETKVKSKQKTAKKIESKPKQKTAKRMESINIIEDYLEALPSVKEYVESDKSHKDIPVIEKFIFSEISSDELYKINLLGLSKKENLLFIREMLYFEPQERDNLIEAMLRNEDKIDEDIIYTPPLKPIETNGQVRVHIISLIEPGEKMKILIIQKTDSIHSVKERVGTLFNYDITNFILSSGGILLKEELYVKDYNIEDDDEIVLIPSKK